MPCGTHRPPARACRSAGEWRRRSPANRVTTHSVSAPARCCTSPSSEVPLSTGDHLAASSSMPATFFTTDSRWYCRQREQRGALVTGEPGRLHVGHGRSVTRGAQRVSGRARRRLCEPVCDLLEVEQPLPEPHDRERSSRRLSSELVGGPGSRRCRPSVGSIRGASPSVRRSRSHCDVPEPVDTTSTSCANVGRLASKLHSDSMRAQRPEAGGQREQAQGWRHVRTGVAPLRDEVGTAASRASERLGLSTLGRLVGRRSR